MIDDRVILFILLTVMSYVFEHKIIPQIAVFSIALIELGVLISEVTSTSTNTDAYYLFLFVISMFYAAYMAMTSYNESDINEVL